MKSAGARWLKPLSARGGRSAQGPHLSAPRRREMSKRAPADFIKQVLGRPVIVKLNNGTDYRGVLACLDGYMNIAMEQTEEYVDGELKNKYGHTVIRGNNVLYISAQPKQRRA
mmetsp:Transcript_35547/g.99383  ORF Transcript_35547/g.99383 Transcript_35547/m.99383 type:complete len:113 (+) Transcript_35547:2-340(+)